MLYTHLKKVIVTLKNILVIIGHRRQAESKKKLKRMVTGSKPISGDLNIPSRCAISDEKTTEQSLTGTNLDCDAKYFFYVIHILLNSTRIVTMSTERISLNFGQFFVPFTVE